MKNKASFARRFADLALSSNVLTSPTSDNRTKEDYLTCMFQSVKIVGRQEALIMLKEIIKEIQIDMGIDEDPDLSYVRLSQRIVLNKLLKEIRKEDKSLQKIQDKLSDKAYKLNNKK